MPLLTPTKFLKAKLLDYIKFIACGHVKTHQTTEPLTIHAIKVATRIETKLFFFVLRRKMKKKKLPKKHE